MKAIVTEFTVPAHRSFGDDPVDQRDEGVTIRRVRSLDEDAWGVFLRNSRLDREALRWRESWPVEPLRHADDRRTDAAPERRAIRECFHLQGMNSGRTDEWNAEHTFTLAEAFYVCGVEAS